jgi:hypothetical protein
LHHTGERADHAAHLSELGRIDLLIGQNDLETVECAAQHIVIRVQRAQRRIELVGEAGDERADRDTHLLFQPDNFVLHAALLFHRNACIKRWRISCSS